MATVDQHITQRFYLFGDFHEETCAFAAALATVNLEGFLRKLSGSIHFRLCCAVKLRIKGSIHHGIKCAKCLAAQRRPARAHIILTGYSHRKYGCIKEDRKG